MNLDIKTNTKAKIMTAEIFFENESGKKVMLSDLLAFLSQWSGYDKITADPGRKYIRLWGETKHNHRSCYAFLDFKGNIYKAATWRAPAKHIRGSVFDYDFSWGRGFDTWGATYLR